MNRIKLKIAAVFTLLLIHFIGGIYLKYCTHNLGINLFRIDYVGNIFNVLIFMLTIVGFLIFIKSSKIDNEKEISRILIITVLSFLPLAIIFALGNTEDLVGSVYLFSIPAVKLLNGILSFGEIFIQFLLIFVIWLFAIDRVDRVYVKSSYLSLTSILLLFVFAFFFIVLRGENTTDIRKDRKGIAVILGAAVWSHDKPSPIFEGRIKKAYYLYQSGYVDNIQLTGGSAPGEISEAETAFNYLTALGVKSEGIRVESRTSTTTQQIQFIKKNLVENYGYKNIVIISDNFHMSRILEICKFYRLDAVGSRSEYEIRPNKLLFYRIRESIALIMFWFFGV